MSIDQKWLTNYPGRDWGQEEKGTTEDEMAGWHHWLDGRESGWTPGVGDGQGGLACCNSWGRKESDTTEWLIWSDLMWDYLCIKFLMFVSCSVVSDSLRPHELYVAHQASPFMEFSKQEYCSGLPFPSPEDLPDPGIEPWSPVLQAHFLPTELPGKPKTLEY